MTGSTAFLAPRFEPDIYGTLASTGRIEEGYADAARIQGDLARIELYARAVPAVTAFVLDRFG